VGEGSGSVKSDRLYIEGCWDGPLNLKPDFFAANPFRDEALQIRIQRGDNIQEMSDGALIVVNDLEDLRSRIGEPITVGLPRGIIVAGGEYDTSSFEPVQVSLAVYLHSTCHTENGTVYSLSGSITFTSLFSGDLNESDAEERLTEGSFSAQFADPRQLTGDAAEDAKVTSEVTGDFRFFFQRGQPAQPFQ
jgi:hypothetical protein